VIVSEIDVHVESQGVVDSDVESQAVESDVESEPAGPSDRLRSGLSRLQIKLVGVVVPLAATSCTTRHAASCATRLVANCTTLVAG